MNLKLLMLKLVNMSENVFSAENQQERLLTPEYIVGLVDGEGYFSISPVYGVYKNYSSFEVKMIFGIDLREEDHEILERVQQYFNCGHLSRKIEKRENFSNQVRYQVKDRSSILNKIIPFFEKYPLQFASRQRKFKIFLEVAEIVKKEKYKTSEGFEKVKNLVAQMRRKNPQRLHVKPLLKQGEDIVHAL